MWNHSYKKTKFDEVNARIEVMWTEKGFSIITHRNINPRGHLTTSDWWKYFCAC